MTAKDTELSSNPAFASESKDPSPTLGNTLMIDLVAPPSSGHGGPEAALVAMESTGNRVNRSHGDLPVGMKD
jgi:hypothetical protein